MYTIKTKNKSFSGILANITFINGVATVDKLTENDIKWFENYGHLVEGEEEMKKTKSTKQKVNEE